MAAVSQDAFDAPPAIITLGGAQVESSTADVAPAIGPGKPLALLVYLSASPGRTATREHLLDLLWADVEPEAGRHALRQTIWYIRQRLHPAAIAATRTSITLHALVRTDRQRFLDAVDDQRHETAVELYRGQFLPDLALPGGLEFEHWLERERQSLRATFLRCGDAVVRRWLEMGRVREAVTLARRLRDTDPSIESTWRLLLEALNSANDPVGAATEADALTRWLETNAREAEPATRAQIRLARSTTRDASVTGKPRAITAELIGRVTEFAQLVNAWDDAREHGPRHLHIVAPAGVGKTRLVVDFVARLRARRAALALVSARPGDRDIPCASLGEIAGAVGALPGAAAVSPSVARVLVALHPPLSSTLSVDPDFAQGEEAFRRRAAALHELLAAVCEEAPIALIVDDVHWMDDASRRILVSVLQRLERERILVVTTSRPRYPFAGPVAIEQLALAPFTRSQVGALVASLGALPDAPWASRFADDLLAATGGSPLLLLETLQLLIEQQVVALEESVWVATDPRALHETLASGSALRVRLARLPDVDRSVLLALSVAGVPVSRDLLCQSVDASATEAIAALAALEQRGLAASSDDGWQPAHDAVGEMALDAAPDAELRKAHVRLARAYASRRPVDAPTLLRAGRHFAAAHDASSRVQTFVRWVELHRRDSDARATRELAAEFLGSDNDPVTNERMHRAVPLRLRFPRSRITATLATIGVGVVLLGGYAAYPRAKADPPDATLYAFYADSGDTVRLALDIRRSDFGKADFVELRSGRAVGQDLSFAQGLRVSPDGKHVVFDSVYSDSGGQEIVTKDLMSDRVRRLTTSIGDDAGPSWSPDGQRVAFASGRYDERSLYRVAVVELQSQTTRRLTRGDGFETHAAWNPDGTSIAFARRYWDDRVAQLCVAAVDGGFERCFDSPNLAGGGPIGWYDPFWVVVDQIEASRDSSRHLYAINIGTHESRRLNGLIVSMARMSPDGRWILCRCRANATARVRWWIFPVDDPNALREVVRDKLGEQDFFLTWLSTPARDRSVRAVRIVAPGAALPLGAATQLTATMVDRAGAVTPASMLRWTSRDTSVATIDAESGLMVPRNGGTARIVASAGGWVTGEATLRVAATDAASLLTEQWTEGLTAHFVPFGEPHPSVVRDATLGTALSHNGDGSYSSGVYSSRALDAMQGLGLDAVVTTPLTSMQWQSLQISFLPDLPPGELERWDHRTGSLPLVDVQGRGAVCSVAIPYGEGPASRLGFALSDRVGAARVTLPDLARAGKPYRVRVQLLPDGRCGVAINGRALATTRLPATIASRYRLVLGGQNVGTRILIGSLELWSGVKADIDWRRVERR